MALHSRGPFPIHGSDDCRIGTVDDWLAFAPPAGRERQWRDGRSALELARRWVAGYLPTEVTAVLDTSPAFHAFEPQTAWAETKTPLDSRAGNTRTHDLLVLGCAGGQRALLDVEGKAGEPFGPTVMARLRDALVARQRNARSGAAQRVHDLCLLVFGTSPDVVGHLRYQLVHATAAAVIAAVSREAPRVAWVAHEFRRPGGRERAYETSARDLDAFVAHLAGPQLPPPSSGRLAGPIHLRGGSDDMQRVDLYIGKAVHVLSRGRGSDVQA
ncbi:MAG: hypothetical protein HY332_08425 [Chloroflexi bacterium]|nr:hypothetical protein [Chloroflexota bacterium]